MSTQRVPNTTSSWGLSTFLDTKFTNDRNFLNSCLLDKCVVEQLATRVVNVIPTAFILWERCLGLFTHWLVTVSLTHACNVAITSMPQVRKRIHRGIFHFRVTGIILGLAFAFQSDTFVSIGLCGFCTADLLRVTGASWLPVCISVSSLGSKS